MRERQRVRERGGEKRNEPRKSESRSLLWGFKIWRTGREEGEDFPLFVNKNIHSSFHL